MYDLPTDINPQIRHHMIDRQLEFSAQDRDQTSAKKNRTFIQYNGRFVPIMTILGTRSKYAISIFNLLVDNMDYKNQVVISRSYLAHFLQTTPTSISRGLKFLYDHNLVVSTKKNNITTYHLNAWCVWKSAADMKGMATLNRPIYLDPADTKRYNNKIKTKSPVVTTKDE